ncbi:MFS transporter [Micromonospora peucetia]|nr:MFS transporter [Micromonospora peucetia]
MASRMSGLFRPPVAISPQVGRMAAANLFASLGFGMYTAGSAVYFTRHVGIPASQVGAGLTAAGLLWLPLSLYIGRFCDRIGARTAVVWTGAAQAVLLLAATTVHGLAGFLIVVTLLGVVVQGGWICREALVADVVTGDALVGISAYLRSLFNVGVIAGALLSGLALSWDRTPGYQALIIGSALAEATAAVICLRLPKYRQEHFGVSEVPLSDAVRDVPYLALSVLLGILAVGDTILYVGIPLWVLSQPALPPGLGAWLYGLNAVLVIGLQVRLSRAADTYRGVRRLLMLASIATAVSCLAVGASQGRSVLAGVLWLVVAVVLLSLGEVWSAAAGWKIRYDMAPPQAQGTWGGLFALGSSVNLVLGPVLVTVLTARYSAMGWVLLSLAFVAMTTAVVPAMSWALRTRAPRTGSWPETTTGGTAEDPAPYPAAPRSPIPDQRG